jgi:deoxyuridine 5'-triphosphate nucleotidohydrolase
VINPNEQALIPLGIKAFIPAGWWLQLNPRSSTFVKLGLSSLIGVIDEMYEGEIKFAVVNHGPIPVTIKCKDRIGQLIPYERKEVKISFATDEEYTKLSETRDNDRGSGGFGSSGQ